MLNLKEFNVIKQEQNDHFYRFTVERKELPYMCINCGWIKSEHDTSEGVFRPHQVKERTVSDISMHGKKVCVRGIRSTSSVRERERCYVNLLLVLDTYHTWYFTYRRPILNQRYGYGS